MKASSVNVRQLLAQIRKEVRADEEAGARIDAPDLPPADHVLHRPELAYMNRHWSWDVGYDPPRPRSPIAGVSAWLKVRLARFVWNVLERHVQAERDFVENLVRFNNDLAKKCDQLSDEVRMLLRSQMESDVGLARRTDLRHQLLEARVEELEHKLVAEP